MKYSHKQIWNLGVTKIIDHIYMCSRKHIKSNKKYAYTWKFANMHAHMQCACTWKFTSMHINQYENIKLYPNNTENI